MDLNRTDEYKNVLLEISTTIYGDDLTRMKFKCDSIIKKRQGEKIKDPLEFFIALEERGYLSETNISFLKDLLRLCCAGKVDGLRILETYERKFFPGNELGGQNFGPGQFQNQPGVAQNRNQPHVVYVVQNGQLPTQLGFQKPKYEGPDMTAEVNFLCKNLGREWKFFVRALGLPESDIEAISSDYRTVRERIHQCLLSWQCQEQQNASRNKLISALKDRSVERNDLASRLADGKF